jgi:flagellar biosynthesis/type III secretory pathway M-ring protein FliF/YscJ
MESIRSLVRQLEAWWVYASRCVRAPASEPACASFWAWVAVAAAIAAALIALYILRKMAKNFLAVRAEKKRLAEEGRVAGEDTMGNYKVDADKLYAGPREEDVERRIRQALDERKIKDQWQRPSASRKKGPE